MARIGELIEIVEVELPEEEGASVVTEAPEETEVEEGREVEVGGGG